MENFDLVDLSTRCISYLAVLGPDDRTEKLFRESYDGEPTMKGVREFLFDLEDEHSKGIDWLAGHWLMDMVDLNDILKLPLSTNEVLCLRLRIECAIVLLPLLCGSDQQDPPNPRFCLSISASSEREAVLWALTSFWNQTWLDFYNTRIAMFQSCLQG